MVSNLGTIATNYFLSLKLISISWFSCSEFIKKKVYKENNFSKLVRIYEYQ